MVTILSYSERIDLQLELATLANEITNKLSGNSISAVIGYGIKDKVDVLSKNFDKVFVIDSEDLKLFNPITYANVLLNIVNNTKPDIILISDTKRGGAIASALSALLDTGCKPEIYV